MKNETEKKADKKPVSSERAHQIIRLIRLSNNVKSAIRKLGFSEMSDEELAEMEKKINSLCNILAKNASKE